MHNDHGTCECVMCGKKYWRPSAAVKAITYTMSTYEFRQLMGITERGELEISVTGGKVIVSVKS